MNLPERRLFPDEEYAEPVDVDEQVDLLLQEETDDRMSDLWLRSAGEALTDTLTGIPALLRRQAD